jgi:NAD(P)-dependent dehydrogenase (short-subunit alcohol dehydrogenase family)
MPTVMVVGASRGIGLELARQYAHDGWRVHATTRTPEQPGALGTLAGDVVLHALDVRRDEQITALAAAVAHEGIDVLIHNAGVSGMGMNRQEVMAINADAPIKVTEALQGELWHQPSDGTGGGVGRGARRATGGDGTTGASRAAGARRTRRSARAAG